MAAVHFNLLLNVFIADEKITAVLYRHRSMLFPYQTIVIISVVVKGAIRKLTIEIVGEVSHFRLIYYLAATNGLVALRPAEGVFLEVNGQNVILSRILSD